MLLVEAVLRVGKTRVQKPNPGQPLHYSRVGGCKLLTRAIRPVLWECGFWLLSGRDGKMSREDRWEALDARITRLEKQNRWLRLTCLAGCLALACMLTMGQTHAGKTVDAQRIVLRGASGEVRAERSMLDGDYPRLTLLSPNGQKEAELSPLGLSVSDHELSPRLPLAHYGDRGLFLTNSQGNVVLGLGGANAPAHLAPVAEILCSTKAESRFGTCHKAPRLADQTLRSNCRILDETLQTTE
jgi:hypothetical protein